MRNADPAARIARFWAQVDRDTAPDGCWRWTGRVFNGYGAFNFNGQTMGAHRTALTMEIGSLSPGTWALHRCNNRLCVRVHPDHVYAGSPGENSRDLLATGRTRSAVSPLEQAQANGCDVPPAAVAFLRWQQADLRGRTQQRIAAALGVAQQLVSRWIRGESVPQNEQRLLLEALTGGTVRALDWMTAAERAGFDARMATLDAEARKAA